MKYNEQDLTYDQEQLTTEEKGSNFLILHNDDFHSFDFVIDALIKVCNHENEQAVQCTYLVHYKGSCDVKKGKKKDLRKYRKKLEQLGLKATIE